MIKNTIENLEANGFEVIYLKNKNNLIESLKEYFKENCTVGLGGSETVSSTGLLKWLINQKTLNLLNQYEAGISMEENFNRRRAGMLSDVYVTGCNAITEAGYLVNVDGSGNRVASQIFGPKKVLMLVGTNKIVKDTEAAFERIDTIAAAKNVKRLNRKANDLGKPGKYNKDNIQNVFCVIKRSFEKGRTIVVLLDGEYGY